MKNLLKKETNDPSLQLSLTILHSADTENLAHLWMGGSNGIWTCGTPLTTSVRRGTVAVFKTDLNKPGGGDFYICGKFGDPVKEDPKDLDLDWPNPEVGGDKYAYKINMSFKARVPRKVLYDHLKNWKTGGKVSNESIGNTTGKCLISISSLEELVEKYKFTL